MKEEQRNEETERRDNGFVERGEAGGNTQEQEKRADRTDKKQKVRKLSRKERKRLEEKERLELLEQKYQIWKAKIELQKELKLSEQELQEGKELLKELDEDHCEKKRIIPKKLRDFCETVLIAATTVLCGALLLYFILCVAGVIQPIKTIEVSAQGTDSSIIDAEFLQKVQVIEDYLDEHYLFGTDEVNYKDSMYAGMLEALGDPYTCYYTAEEFQALQESTSGSYAGIGVLVSQNAETKLITVVRPFEGFSGANAGLLPGDVLTQVDGMEVSGMDLAVVVSYIKGESGTSVHLQVYRESEERYLEMDVEREMIEVPTVSSEMLADQMGLIQITEFDEVTSSQFETALKELEQQGMEGLVIDLRNNPGGLLSTVATMLDQILPEGTIVYTEDKNGEGEVYTSDEEHQFTKPLVVLINGESASASEVFAGAIQDYGAGTIVGTTSFGKGIVQSIIPFNDGTAIKLTVSHYFTPNGTCIHGVGITPDVEVEMDEEVKQQVSVSAEEDNQLQEAIRVLGELIAQQEQ